MTFDDVFKATEANFKDAPQVQRLLSLSEKFGNSERGDAWAQRIVCDFTDKLRAEAKNIPFVKPIVLIPGFLLVGRHGTARQERSALPNAGMQASRSRRARTPVSASGAMERSRRWSRRGGGNRATATPRRCIGCGLRKLDTEQAVSCLKTLIRTHSNWGTLMNISVVDEQQILKASKIPRPIPI